MTNYLHNMIQKVAKQNQYVRMIFKKIIHLKILHTIIFHVRIKILTDLNTIYFESTS